MTIKTVTDINSLVRHPEGLPDPLPPAESKGAIAGRGVSRAAGAASGLGPLVEKDANDRLYHPEIVYPSSDGVFWLAVEPIQRMSFTNQADGSTVVVEYQPEPPFPVVPPP
jgi:hypothetical protein